MEQEQDKVAGHWRTDSKGGPPVWVEEHLRTKTGKVLTDDDVEALADEAEAGYDVSHMKRPNPATVNDPDLQQEFLAGFNEGQPPTDAEDSDTTDEVRPVELTVEDLISLLDKMPADAKVALVTRHNEAEEFTVELDDTTGWVILSG